jgi:hypothetical protein
MDFMDRIRTRAQARRTGEYLGARIGKIACLAQHDFDVANGSGATVRGDINDALEAAVTNSSGATAPATTYAHQFWADTTTGVLKQRNTANTAWLVRDTLAESFVTSRASNTILAAADHAKPFVATATFTQTLTAAATLGDGWWVPYRVNSGVTTTFDPNGAENIDGAATKAVVGPSSGIIYCSGSAFYTYGFDDPSASDTVAGLIEVAVQSEMEAGSSTTLAVTPGRQHYHPSAAKGWCFANFSGTAVASYNVTSVTDTGTGDVSINWATDFSSASYCAVATTKIDFGGVASTTYATSVQNTTTAAGVTRVYNARVSDGQPIDPNNWNVVAFGDH